MSNQLIVLLRISEKSYVQSQNQNVYVFDVPLTANKVTVKEAVQSQYDVKVIKVNILVQDGKAKRTGRKRSQPISGRRNKTKHAYVTLAPGDSITVFETEGEA